jgi:uncharacterized Ntn-hydrolase superfamily protein
MLLVPSVAPAAEGLRPVATFTIVARDSASGEIGIGVTSHWFSVGTAVPWVRAGVGAVATQSFVEKGYGPRILDRVAGGERCTTALVRELDADSAQDWRQVLVLDARGNSGAHTGEACIPYAGHHVARDHVCGGNLLAAPGVWDSMSAAFRRTEGPLAERLLAALDAGQAAGGDARGRQSAALVIERPESPATPWKSRVVDLRVEDHPRPLEELRRLVTLRRAYDHADAGDAAFASGDHAAAFRSYDAALALVPENDELLFWRASMQMAAGREPEAAQDAAHAIRLNERWRALLARIPETAFPGAAKLAARLGVAREE